MSKRWMLGLLGMVLFGCATAANAASFQWKTGESVVSPIADREHPIVSVKDPSVVKVGDRWHIFATTADKKGGWGMVYLNFQSWPKASQARQVYLDSNPHLKGYHCAPQVFYFTPQKKWYLIFQSGQPQYSTSDKIDDPASWSQPTDFFAGVPKSVKNRSWLDFWIICDKQYAYLFFTGDNGRFYRSRTSLKDFPKGMSEPVLALSEPNAGDLFEGGATYKIKGQNKYLTMIEAIGQGGKRYYRSFTADTLDGTWQPLAATWENPFAAITHVTFEKGVKPWTEDISHGELLRDGYDETLTVDLDHLGFLFQGRDPKSNGMDYSQLPYRLGLLEAVK